MLLSKTCQYAIRGLVHINLNTKNGERAGLKTIAESTGTPVPFLSKVLMSATKHGFIGSVKGPGGGFYRNEKTPNITLLQVIEAVEGPEYCNRCLLGLPDCSDDKPCPAHFTYKSVREDLHEMFTRMTIDQLSNNLDKNQGLFRLG